MKQTLKGLRNSAIAALKPHRLPLPGAGLLILTYHRVLPRDYTGLERIEPGMYVHDDTLAMHLRVLADEVEFIDLAEWLSVRESGGALPKRACAITFDDGWKDNFDYAFPVLKAAGVPATIFVVTGMVGSARQFWPERLAAYLSSPPRDSAVTETRAGRWARELADRVGLSMGSASADEISAAIGAAKAFSDEDVHGWLNELEAHGYRPPAVERASVNWAELEEMQSSGLVAVGSHTVNHVRLIDGVGKEAVEAELVGSANTIAERLGRPPSLFCYPNGDVSESALACARSNYVGACTTRHGWNGRRTDAHLLRRMTMHEGSSGDRRSLLAKISGLV